MTEFIELLSKEIIELPEWEHWFCKYCTKKHLCYICTIRA